MTLVVSLPDGRRELALEQPAVALLREGFDPGVGSVVPDAAVPVLVAAGDARLPGQDDAESTVGALPSGGTLAGGLRAAVVEYLASSPVADHVDPALLADGAPANLDHRLRPDSPASNQLSGSEDIFSTGRMSRS